MSNQYTPFTYRITSKTTGQHYYGSRYANGCHPDDLWTIYFTSSKIVHDMIEQYGKDDFIVEIRKIFNTRDQTRLWESNVLKKLKVRNKEDWINIAFGGYATPEHLSEEHKQK